MHWEWRLKLPFLAKPSIEGIQNLQPSKLSLNSLSTVRTAASQAAVHFLKELLYPRFIQRLPKALIVMLISWNHFTSRELSTLVSLTKTINMSLCPENQGKDLPQPESPKTGERCKIKWELNIRDFGLWTAWSPCYLEILWSAKAVLLWWEIC